MMSSAAWADCLPNAGGDTVTCDGVGTLGWEGSNTDALTVNVSEGATVSTYPVDADALITTGADSVVNNFSGSFDNGTNVVPSIDAGSDSDPAVALGSNGTFNNASNAYMTGSISFNTATGTDVNNVNNLYAVSGTENLIGIIDGDIISSGNTTVNNQGVMGWFANVGITQTGEGTVVINNGVVGGYAEVIENFDFFNGILWAGSETVISTDGSTTLTNYGGGNDQGSLIQGDVILGNLGLGTSTIYNGSEADGPATLSGNVTMNDMVNVIDNYGTIDGDVDMNGTVNTFNAYDGANIPSGTLTGFSGSDNTLNLDGDGTFGGNITNFYSINKDGDGTWTLDGQLSADMAQAVNINNGILEVTDADYLNTVGGTTLYHNSPTSGNGGLLFTGDADGDFAGNITGTGNVGVTGPSVTTLSGSNDYTGWTYIFNGGTLNADSTGALSNSTDVYLAGSTFNVNANSMIDALYDYDVNTGGNTSTVNLNGSSLAVASGNFGDEDGTIAGTGTLIKYSTGALDLYGPDLIAPASIVINDGIVNDNNGAIGDDTAVSVNSDSVTSTAGRLNVLDDDTIGSLAGTGTGAIVNLSSGATLATGGDDTSTTYAGQITGDGALAKEGTGTMTLTGANTYVGGTTVSEGTLVGFAGSNASLKGDIDVALDADLVFDQKLPATPQSGTYAGELSGDGTVTFIGDATTVLTLSGDNTGLAGTMAFDSGTVAIGDTMNVGTGTLYFDGGTLQSSADITLGNAVTLDEHNGTFNTNTDTTLTLNGAISGDGSLTKIGGGTLELGGFNSYTGGTTVSAGTLVGGAGTGIQGDVLNNALVIFKEDFEVYSGYMSGTGSVVIDANPMGFDGTNTYSGTTTILETSHLDAFDTDTLSPNSAFIVNGDLHTFYDQTIGSLAGASTGLIILDDDSLLTAGGDNTSTTFAGDFTGVGSFLKVGTGTLTLGGSGNTLGGNLGVDGGVLDLTGLFDAGSATVGDGAKLYVDGTLSAPTITVDLGGTLGGGVGTTPGLIVGDVTVDGTMSPGHSPGIMNIDGSYTQTTGSTFAADVYGNGTTTVVADIDFDQVRVSGDPGTAALDGTLSITQNGGLYVDGTTYDILTATGGITGDFADVTGNVISPFITISNDLLDGGGVVTVVDDDDTYRLIVVRSAYNTVALNPNQFSVADGLQGLVGDATAASTVIQIDNMTAAEAQSLFDQVSPESYGAYATVLQDQGNLFTRQVAGRMDMAPRDGAAGIWINGYSQWGNGGNNDYRYGSDRDIVGVSGGVDFDMSGTLVGVAAGYSDADVDYLLGNASGDSKSWQVGGYASLAAGKIRADAQVAYIDGSIDSTKLISASSGPSLISGEASASTSGNLFKGILTLGYDAGSGNLSLVPFVGVDFTSGKIDGFTESGMGALSLTVDDIDADRTDVLAGVKLSANADNVMPYLNATYRYRVNGNSRDVTAYFNDNPPTTFTVSALNSGRSQVDFDAGIGIALGSSARAFVGYQGMFRSDLNSHGAYAGISFSFGGASE